MTKIKKEKRKEKAVDAKKAEAKDKREKNISTKRPFGPRKMEVLETTGDCEDKPCLVS